MLDSFTEWMTQIKRGNSANSALPIGAMVHSTKLHVTIVNNIRWDRITLHFLNQVDFEDRITLYFMDL